MKRSAPPLTYQTGRCTFLCAQRASHQLMRFYDDALAPVELTNAQFSFLVYLHQARSDGVTGTPVSALADFVGLNRPSLRRELQPLKARGLVAEARYQADRRRRAVAITDAGCAKLSEAQRAWRRARTRMQRRLGLTAALRLNGLLDEAWTKLKS